MGLLAGWHKAGFVPGPCSNCDIIASIPATTTIRSNWIASVTSEAQTLPERSGGVQNNPKSGVLGYDRVRHQIGPLVDEERSLKPADDSQCGPLDLLTAGMVKIVMQPPQ